MAKMKRILPVSIIAASLLLTALTVTQHTSADNVGASKTEKQARLKQLQEQEKAEMYTLESMKPKTPEEADKKDAQAMKVKQVGIEAGNLQRELHPQLTRDKVAMKILVIKDVLNENRDYAEKAKDPVNGAKYQKAYEILQMKTKMLDQIEGDFQANSKSLVQISKELDDLTKIHELE